MKTTSKTQTPQLPISQKAYAGFRQRITDVNRSFGHDPAPMLEMLDRYLSGDKNPDCHGDTTCAFAFGMMRHDIDLAITRSARAREAARRRRELRERDKLNAAPAHKSNENTSAGDSTPTAPDASKYASAYAEALRTCIRAQLYPDEYWAEKQPQHSIMDACGRRPYRDVLKRYIDTPYPTGPLTDDPIDCSDPDTKSDSPCQY